jgi:O-antigen/teichoic acid export membrane protein
MLRRLLKHSVFYTLASVLSKGISVLLLPLYARIMSPGDFGAFDLVITFGALANLVVALEISQGLARYWPECSGLHKRKSMASTTLWFAVLMYAVFLVLSFLFFEKLLDVLIGDSTYQTALQFGIFYISINGVSLHLMNLFRWQLRAKAYAVISFMQAVYTLIFTYLLCVQGGKGIEGVIAALLIASAISLMTCLWIQRAYIGWIFDRQIARRLLQFSMPLVPAGLASFLMVYFNRAALAYYGGVTEVGYFSVANRLASIMGILVVGVRGALTPLIYQNHRDPATPKGVSRSMTWFLGGVFSLALFLGLFSAELVKLLVGPGYLDASSAVMPLALAAAFSQLYVFAPGISIKKKMYWQFWIFLFTALAGVALNIFMVPRYGLEGAAWATFITAMISFGIWVLVAQRYYRVPYEGWLCTGMATILVGAMGLQWFFGWGNLLAMDEWWSKISVFVVSVIAIIALLVSGLVRERVAGGVGVRD